MSFHKPVPLRGRSMSIIVTWGLRTKSQEHWTREAQVEEIYEARWKWLQGHLPLTALLFFFLSSVFSPPSSPQTGRQNQEGREHSGRRWVLTWNKHATCLFCSHLGHVIIPAPYKCVSVVWLCFGCFLIKEISIKYLLYCFHCLGKWLWSEHARDSWCSSPGERVNTLLEPVWKCCSTSVLGFINTFITKYWKGSYI